MKTAFIESDYSSFRDFHDGAWYKKIFDAVSGSHIEISVEEFATHWWGTSRAFVLPWLLVTGVYDAAKGSNVCSKQDLWQKYLEINAFSGSLWKTAGNAYIGIYYAYECLLVNVVNSRLTDNIRVTDKKFGSVVSRQFGASVASKVWNCSAVSMPKEIRNCLVHNGGKATSKLLKMKPLPTIDHDNVLISASDVRALHQALKPCVELIIESYTNANGI